MTVSATLKQRLPLIVAVVVGLAVIIGGTVWWLGNQRWETTDNAFVQADTTLVSPQVNGYVVEVLVRDNQRVAPGQILVRLDDADARARLAEAEANLQALIAAVGNVDARAAQQRIQTEQAGAATAQAAVAQAQAALVAEQRTAAVLGSTRRQSVAAVEQARAAVDQARTALDRTIIRAPVAGVVGARGVRAGQYVNPGAQLLSIVPLGDTYVVANFKETQLDGLRLGQTVEITADAFPGRHIRGRIDSFAPATGSEFALIPVENATGNFTKITQRVPVRIVVDRAETGAAALRPGLSVEVRVDLKSAGGLSFAQVGGDDPRLAEVATAQAVRQ